MAWSNNNLEHHVLKLVELFIDYLQYCQKLNIVNLMDTVNTGVLLNVRGKITISRHVKSLNFYSGIQ